MDAFSLSQAKDVKVGNDAAWALEFYAVAKDGTPGALKATFKSSDYYASIEASLQDGLSGGAYTIKIHGLTDADYALVTQANPDRPILAKLYLYWHDAISGVGSYLGSLAGLSSDLKPDDLKKALVATLYVDTVKRSLGALTYDTDIHGVEWVFYALGKPLAEKLDAEDYRAAAAEIALRTHVTIAVHPDGSGRLTPKGSGAADNEKVSFSPGKSPAALLGSMSKALETSLGKYGRGMLLVRDGELHLGERPYPLLGDPKDLTPDTGLLETAADGSSPEDPSTNGSPERAHFSFLLKGRPDLKPGDIVRFDLPPGDEKTTPSFGAALLGSFAAPFLPSAGGLSKDKKSLAVASVRHRLSRESGFSTEVKGVMLKDPKDVWDVHADPTASTKGKEAPRADAGGDASDAIREQMESVTENLRAIEVGEVRAFTAKGTQEDVPSQTLSAREGLKAEDRNPNGSRRLAIDPKRGTRMDIPYATPFAWGKCGLVLPRYPGTRIVMAHRHGIDTEAIDVGAVWESGQGPDSQPGDYWLSLPRGVEKSKRDSIPDTEDAKPYTGPATHDLIDADGNRVIEVGALTVRIGAKDKLKEAGQRPKMDNLEDAVVIEHTGKGARIEIDKDGKITISGQNIEIAAPDGEIKLSAKNVNVEVSGSMNVKDP